MIWAEVPLPVWIMVSVLGAWSAVLTGVLVKVRKVLSKQDGYLVEMDRAINVLEEKLPKLDAVSRATIKSVRELRDQCAELARPLVRPSVPSTSPIRRQRAGGRHSALAEKPPEMDSGVFIPARLRPPPPPPYDGTQEIGIPGRQR